MGRKRAKGTFNCPKCERVFGMQAHLARHLSTIHASAADKAAKARAKVTKKTHSAPVGRPSGLVSRLGLRDMTLEQLGEVIRLARIEAQRKLVELQATFN